MALLETISFGLGTAVVKTACGILLGGNQLGTEISGNAIDIAAQKLQGVREQRRLRRFWDDAAEVVAERLEPLLEKEFRDLTDNELAAGVRAVQDTFDQAMLTERDLFAQDLDAGYLDRHLRGQDPDAVCRAGLSDAASSLYDLLLRQCCSYVIEMVQALPSAGTVALTEILRRERQLIDDMRTVLERLPERRGVADFERDYRQLVAKLLDQVELFGVTLADSSRRYPLSVAYLTLSVSGDFTIQRPGERPLFPMDDPGPSATSPLARVDDVLASTRRLFIRGQAGLGKTTLLQWIAVRSARQDFPERLADWNDTVPFLVRLRQHAESTFPAAEQFVTEVGRHIAAEMPPGWVQEQLRSGRGVVLVDGVDELTPQRRTAARRWLRELIAAFPNARYVVTSRPAAATPDWLRGDDFDVAELEPMDREDVRTFVSRWHGAMREQCDRAEDRERLSRYEQRLLDSLATRRHLRALAGYPLLCALLCALHLDRHGELPRDRMELYDVALQMLLERRDRDRQIQLTTRDALPELASLSQLTQIGIGGMPDLRTLDPIGFVDRLSHLAVTDCAALEDVSSLIQWAGSLRSLDLRDCPALNLDTLPDLSELTALHLADSGQLDLTPVSRLPHLTWLSLGDSQLPDLHPLRNAPNLKGLDILDSSEIDLTQLAGREGLTVTVWGSATVHGADQLGPGSRVIRRRR